MLVITTQNGMQVFSGPMPPPGGQQNENKWHPNALQM